MGKKVAIRIQKKSGERVFEADSLMEINIFVPAWRPRSVSEVYSERVASILLFHLALFRVALHCFVLRWPAWLRFASLGVGNWDE